MGTGAHDECEKRLREMGLCILEKSRLRGEPVAIFYLLERKDGAWSRGNSHRLEQEKTPLG